MRMTDEEIEKAYFKILKRKGWKPMETYDGCAWFGGKNHVPVLDYLPEGTLDERNFEDIDFLVIGWKV